MTDPNQYNPQVPQPAAQYGQAPAPDYGQTAPQYGTPDYGQAQAPQYAAPNYNQALSMVRLRSTAKHRNRNTTRLRSTLRPLNMDRPLSTARLQPRITGSRHRNRSRAIASSH